MRKALLIVAAIMAMTLSAYAYDGVSKLFVEENGELFNSLSLSAKYELLNNYSRDDKTVVLNNLHTEESRILSLTDEHMTIATSSGKVVEMKMLHKSKRDTVIAVIETVMAPYRDSRISFYDAHWKNLKTEDFIKEPTLVDFISDKCPKNMRSELLGSISFAMIEMKFNGENLEATCGMDNFFLGQDYKRYQPYVIPKIVYSIKKAKFKKQ